jgi:hypothetical protein
MLIPINETAPVIGSIASAFTGSGIDLKHAEGWSLHLIISDTTPAAKNFVSVSGNNITITAHGFTTGLVGQCTTTGGLPTGLSTSTNYFVIAIDANTIQLASSLANALAGTPVTLSSAGTGTNTFTATALGSATAKIQYSNDNSNWTTMPSPNGSTNITGTANLMFSDNRPFYRYIRHVFAIGSGQLSVTATFCAKQ